MKNPSEAFFDIYVVFWCILWRSEAFLWVQGCSKISWRFWGILLCFETFWSALICFERFWKIPEGSEVFPDVLVVSWGFQTLSHAFSLIRSSSERIQKAQKYTVTLTGGILRYSHGFWSGSERILSVLRCSLMFFGILSRSNLFSGVLTYSERLYMVLLVFERLFDILKCSEAFSIVLRISKGFSKLLRCFLCERIFWGNLMRSHGSVSYLYVRNILRCCRDLSGSLRYSHVFWIVLKHSWTFRAVMLRCTEIWGVPVGCERFIKDLRYFLTFWSFLTNY